MSDLPDGWYWSTIGEVASVQLGRQRSPENHVGDHMRPYLRSANVTWAGLDLRDVKEMNFPPADAQRFELQHGDLLINESSGSPNEVGKPAIWRSEIPGACFQNTLLALRPHLVTPKFMYWWLYQSAKSGKLGAAARGVNIRHLGKAGLASYEIPVPPVDAQDRITEYLETEVDRVAAAGQLLSDCQIRLSQFTRSSVQSALSGDWPVVRLGDVSIDQRYGTSAKTTRDSSGVPVLRMGNIRLGAIDVEDLKYVPYAHEDVESCSLAIGDVLFNRTNSPELVGKSAVFRGVPTGALFASYLIRVRTDPQRLLPEWASLVINSSFGREYIESVRTQQVGQANVNGTKLAAFPIPLPPTDVQQQRIDEFERLRVVEHSVRSGLDAAISKSQQLKLSLLTSALRGTLEGIRND